MRPRALVGAIAATFVVLTPTAALAANGDGAAVTGEVYLDLDGDGTRDAGEPGRGNVQLTLRTDAAILDATMTDPDGTWSFNNVTGGTVTLVVEPPNDLAVTGSTIDGLDRATGEASVDVTGDAALGAIGLGSPLASGPDMAALATTDAAAGSPDGFRWELTALNLGADAAGGPIDLRAVLSSGHEAVAADGEGWTCERSTAIVLCTATDDLPAGGALPTLSLVTQPVGDVGTRVSVTATVRLDGVFDSAPLNDEDVASRTISALDTEDLDGDGDVDIANAGAPVRGVLVAVLLALVVGATAVTTTRRPRRP